MPRHYPKSHPGVLFLASAAETKAAIDAGFETYIRELEQTAGVWETKPAVAAEGEDAWSARQVAEHIGGSGLFFAAGIAPVIGVEPPPLARMSFPEQNLAVSETRRTHGLFMDVVANVTDDNIGIEIDHQRMGKTSVGGLMDLVSHHLTDHAQQLKTLRGG